MGDLLESVSIQTHYLIGPIKYGFFSSFCFLQCSFTLVKCPYVSLWGKGRGKANSKFLGILARYFLSGNWPCLPSEDSGSANRLKSENWQIGQDSLLL